MLKSEHPILAVPMENVSDIDFAIACSQVGITPSIGLSAYLTKGSIDYERLVDDLIRFKRTVGNANLAFSLYATYLLNDDLITVLKYAGIEILEIIFPWYDAEIFSVSEMEERLIEVSKTFITLQRLLRYNPSDKKAARRGHWLPFMSGAILKGSDGAGTVADMTTDELLKIVTELHPGKMYIASGGIHCKEQIDHYLQNGAVAVGIGTLFALSAESKIATEAKQKMLRSESFKHEHYEDKNAVVFKPLQTGQPNHNASLKLGIHHPEIGGHVYCGTAAKQVKKIRPLKTIVKDLTT
jgi:NAD(P)H-dependent flavin oxidoreductase YrpB (nitropropane dioxygenase family)